VDKGRKGTDLGLKGRAKKKPRVQADVETLSESLWGIIQAARGQREDGGRKNKGTKGEFCLTKSEKSQLSWVLHVTFLDEDQEGRDRPAVSEKKRVGGKKLNCMY